MGEPLSLDRVFDFPEDELEPHPAYDFFAPAPLPGYAGNPNYNNGWLAADDYLLGELEAMADQQMVVPAVDEIAEQVVIPAIEEVAEPVVEADEEQVIAPVVDVAEGQMDAPIMDIEEDLAALFDDDDFEDDASDGFGKEEVWEVSDVEVAAGVTIGELGPRVYEVDGQVQMVVSQVAQAADRWEQVQALQTDVQQGDTQIQQLQTTVTEMSNRESTLMRCILGLERWIAALERRPPGP
ncbi:hypothetical protein Tco_1498106 [Tanacetum coccineum]